MNFGKTVPKSNLILMKTKSAFKELSKFLDKLKTDFLTCDDPTSPSQI